MTKVKAQKDNEMETRRKGLKDIENKMRKCNIFLESSKDRRLIICKREYLDKGLFFFFFFLKTWLKTAITKGKTTKNHLEQIHINTSYCETAEYQKQTNKKTARGEGKATLSVII